MQTMRSTMITAHSGCEGTPDNSLEYVEYALELSVHCLEVDVRMNGGGLILSHDKSIEGKGYVHLSEVFERLGDYPDILVNCDLKHAGLEKPVYDLACRYGVERQLVCSGGSSLQAWHSMMLNIQLFINIELIFPEIYTRSFMDNASAATLYEYVEKIRSVLEMCRAACINVNYKRFAPGFFAELKQRDVPFSVWTLDDAEDIRRFIYAGAYNITTRRPLLALSLMDKNKDGRST